MKRATLTNTLAMLMLASTSSYAGIGVFSTSDASDCNLTIASFEPGTLYVIYLRAGGPQAMRAEYRIIGMPGTFGVSFTAVLTPAPGSNFNSGNAFDGTGHIVGWPEPQPFDANGNLLLATYTITNLGAAVPPATWLRVTTMSPPVGLCGYYGVPLVMDAESKATCVSGGTMDLGGGSACIVAIEPHTWSEVRSLYR